eukprot:scaffold61853_cov18-Tisochrysis_lutea.AAC.2
MRLPFCCPGCRVYLSKLKLAKDMDYFTGRLAALTPGMTGADISNVCNEAALCAGRLGMGHIDLPQFESAIDRVIGGLEKKHKVHTCFAVWVTGPVLLLSG